MLAGQDVLAARPTLLLALALEGLPLEKRSELLDALRTTTKAATSVSLQRVRRFFDEARVFDKADKLIEKYRARAEAIADEVEPTELRELLYYLVDSVLDRQAPPSDPPVQLVQLSV
jgi:geranylgeranyl diphosphate synthase, type II